MARERCASNCGGLEQLSSAPEGEMVFPSQERYPVCPAPATTEETSSLRVRRRIEEAFGWAKTVAGLRKARHRGLAKVGWQFTLAMAAYNLVRLPRLFGSAPA